MKKIILLSDNIINTISAGEVIKYPSCICRELIDNAIDALSSKIKIEIFNGGIDYIKISDNGIGMSYEDAILCFKKHTTSKLYHLNDLIKIKTRGFRGEALASICSIALVEIVTKTIQQNFGTKIIIKNDLVNIQKVSCQAGTTIIIKNIFHNIPIRKINLRKPNIESLYIQKVIETNSISYPEISFQFIKNNKYIFTTNCKNEILNKIKFFYGDEFTNTLLSLSYNHEDYIINGYISSPKYVTKNKSIQYIFVNNRIIKSELINKAIKAVFKKYITINENPTYILFLNIPYDQININIHPTKSKILFLEKEKIFNLIKDACEYTIIKNFENNLPINNIPILIQNINKNLKNDNKSNINFKVLGECFNIYILILYCDKLIIIDKHAAHEKLIYNALLNKLNNQILNIKLEKICILEMDFLNINFIINNIDFFQKIGFVINIFGQTSIVIRKIPIFIDKTDIEISIYNIINIIKKENYILSYDYKEFINKIIAKFACNYAIKKSSKYNNIKIENIIKKIINNKSLQYCPHGRPIIMSINKKDIDKHFKRV